MKSRRHRHWIHIADQYHGDRWTAERMTPRNIGTNEPKTPRLYVASSITRCLAARYFARDAFVYRTTRERSAINPGRRVWDQLITREHWIVPPVEMEMVGVIPHGIIQEIFDFARAPITEAKACNFRVRLEIFASAIRVMEGQPEFDAATMVVGSDRAFVRRALERMRSLDA